MHSQVSGDDFAALLEHSSWVRRLAGSLVRDDALADDLTQEAWLAALRHPPDKGLPPRPWLAQVLRNLVRMRFRSDGRRKGRELATGDAATSSDGQLDSPEQLLDRVQTQRALTNLVIAIDEPFRSTILLRYYEGLDSADIAKRQGVPAGTVRWRLKTGLERLRVELDRTHGGDRRAWLPAIAPLAFDLNGHGAAPGIPAGIKLKSALALKTLLPLLLLISAGAAALFVMQRKTEPPRSKSIPASTVVREKRVSEALPRLDKQQRNELLSRIEKAQVQSATSRSPATPPPVLDEEYIRGQMQALIPLIKECYENALRDQPKLGGRLVVNFTIVAEPDIGGLVADSTIDGKTSTIDDAAMRECVQETMYGAQFPAPQDGGELHVTYPFIFTPVDEKN